MPQKSRLAYVRPGLKDKLNGYKNYFVFQFFEDISGTAQHPVPAKAGISSNHLLF